jgi:hypothetical protein
VQDVAGDGAADPLLQGQVRFTERKKAPRVTGQLFQIIDNLYRARSVEDDLEEQAL